MSEDLILQILKERLKIRVVTKPSVGYWYPVVQLLLDDNVISGDELPVSQDDR